MAFDSDIAAKARSVLSACREHGLILAAAESCTGGLLIASLTDIAGSSDVVAGGMTTYSNNAKHKLINVSTETLETYGAVSEQVASEMARGVATAFGCPLSASITGIAGPDGGNKDKPVGTVHITTCLRGQVQHKKHHFNGDRHAVRMQSVSAALDMLLEATKT